MSARSSFFGHAIATIDAITMTAETKVVSDYCDHSVSRIHVVIVGNQSPEIVAITGMKKKNIIRMQCVPV